MKVRVEKIGPIMAQVYSKELKPYRFTLVPIEALPSGTEEGDEVEVDTSAFSQPIPYRRPPNVEERRVFRYSY